jgi:hypothetical protein
MSSVDPETVYYDTPVIVDNEVGILRSRRPLHSFYVVGVENFPQGIRLKLGTQRNLLRGEDQVKPGHQVALGNGT